MLRMSEINLKEFDLIQPTSGVIGEDLEDDWKTRDIQQTTVFTKTAVSITHQSCCFSRRQRCLYFFDQSMGTINSTVL